MRVNKADILKLIEELSQKFKGITFDMVMEGARLQSHR